MKEQNYEQLPHFKEIIEQGNNTLKHIFKDKIRGYFLIDIKNKVIEKLGLEGIWKYYDFDFSSVKMITGIRDSGEYDICRIIVGIHRANTIFLSKKEIKDKEKNDRYKQQIISETIEKIKLRHYGSAFFRKKIFIGGEEFLYYPLPYELFVMSTKMNQMLSDGVYFNYWQLYYGVMYNSISALTLLESALLGTAYPLCRGAIEMYLKLSILVSDSKFCNKYEEFREFEVRQSCKQIYPKEFNEMFENRICEKSVNKADYLHFGWVDFIDEYHNIVRKSPYSINGIITFLKNRNKERSFELENLESFYKACHVYTHGSIQTLKYPVLHYFEISIMLYYIIRDTFLLLCKEKGEDIMINGYDIISMADRDFKIMYSKYEIRSTDLFEKYYNSSE